MGVRVQRQRVHGTHAEASARIIRQSRFELKRHLCLIHAVMVFAVRVALVCAAQDASSHLDGIGPLAIQTDKGGNVRYAQFDQAPIHALKAVSGFDCAIYLNLLWPQVDAKNGVPIPCIQFADPLIESLLRSGAPGKKGTQTGVASKDHQAKVVCRRNGCAAKPASPHGAFLDQMQLISLFVCHVVTSSRAGDKKPENGSPQAGNQAAQAPFVTGQPEAARPCFYHIARILTDDNTPLSLLTDAISKASSRRTRPAPASQGQPEMLYRH